MDMNTQMDTQIEELIKESLDTMEDNQNHLVVFNDNVNTFEHVIDTFVTILSHTPEQAEQCAMIIHTKGKCKVKAGDYDLLEPMCTAILDRGISAQIQ